MQKGVDLPIAKLMDESLFVAHRRGRGRSGYDGQRQWWSLGHVDGEPGHQAPNSKERHGDDGAHVEPALPPGVALILGQ